jgi:hypothetical protein
MLRKLRGALFCRRNRIYPPPFPVPKMRGVCWQFLNCAPTLNFVCSAMFLIWSPALMRMTDFGVCPRKSRTDLSRRQPDATRHPQKISDAPVDDSFSAKIWIDALKR